MSWYRSYVKESLYGPPAPAGGRLPLRTTVQQKLAACNQPLLGSNDGQQPTCPFFAEDDSFFGFRGIVKDERGSLLLPSASIPSTGSVGSAAVTAQTARSASNTGAQPQLYVRSGTVNVTSVLPMKEPDASGTRDQVAIAPCKSSWLCRSMHHNTHDVSQQPSAWEIAPAAATRSSGAGLAIDALSPAGGPCSSSNSSLPSIRCPSPCVEVELQQRRGSSTRGFSSSSNSGQLEACADPLLHWADCWAGPGLRRRTRAVQQQQQQHHIQFNTESMQPNSTPSRSPRTQQQQQRLRQAAMLGASAQLPLSPGAYQPSLSADMSDATIPVSQQQRQSQQPPGQGQRCSLHWWLLGGVGLAALSGCAMVAAYGVMTYVMKAAMVYSFAWKAATGVAAAEGLALGGWSVSSARAGKASAAAAAAELSCLRSQAGRELMALQVLLQQREASCGQEVSNLSALNERLNHIAQHLKSENASLQAALEQAAAERKALEAAAALESCRAETSAVLRVAAAHSGRVVDEVVGLAAQQQQLVALVCDLREDLLGLVGGGDADAAAAATAAKAAALLDSGKPFGDGHDHAELTPFDEDLSPAGAGKSAASTGSAGCNPAAAPPGRKHAVSSGSGCSEPPGHEAVPGCAAANNQPQWSSKASSGTAATTICGETALAAAAEPDACDPATAAKDSPLLKPPPAPCSTARPAPLLQLKSVRGGVDAALAATVADTLLL